MRILLDSNILIRSVQPAHPMYQTAVDSVVNLRNRGEQLCIAPQSLYEFWVVAPRPLASNGLGMTCSQSSTELRQFKSHFRLLPENMFTYMEWERLVLQHQVTGKPAHDARYAALLATHRLDHILTFNCSDFKRFTHITAIDPYTVV